MKLSIEPRRIPLLLGISGVAGFLLRIWLSLTGADASGLLLPGHPAAVMLLILTPIALAVLYLHIRPLAVSAPYGKLFPQSNMAAIGYGVAAIGVLFAGFSEGRILERSDR